jgi:colanic acid/amylovoran biosynthesis protein
MDFWLVGHAGCYNRGCEAIVRSTVALIREVAPSTSIRLLSHEHLADTETLRDLEIEITDGAADFRKTFHGRSITHKVRRRLAQAGPSGRRIANRWLQASHGTPRAMLSVGGDTFSLDYGYPGGFLEHGLQARAYGIPFVIWGASIGPFSAAVESELAGFLKDVSLITSRETASSDYLASLGVEQNVVQVWDPAFALEPAPYDGHESKFVTHDNVVGLNVSAMIAKWFPNGDVDRMLAEVAGFVRDLVKCGYRVLLVPHVTQPSAELPWNDEATLRRVLAQCADLGDCVRLLPGSLGARQVKWMISKCCLFIGARTHATIAAMSSVVPTLAISYSQKARGICHDVFGHERYLLRTHDLSRESLLNAFETLCAERDEARQTLVKMKPTMLAGARQNVQALIERAGVPS